MALLSHTSTRRRRGLHANQELNSQQPGQRSSFFAELFNTTSSVGSHMPLDTESHWRWNDPVNLLPGLVLLLLLLVGIML